MGPILTASDTADGRATAGADVITTDRAAPGGSHRLMETPTGARVAGVLASWMGDDATQALLKHARAGRYAREDVLQAIGHPLTALLGERAGRALAARLGDLAQDGSGAHSRAEHPGADGADGADISSSSSLEAGS